MTKDEYLRELQELEIQHAKAIKLLRRDFAKSQETIKIGEIATDHIGAIKVTSISWAIPYSNIPEPLYIGIELKKDGTPKKVQTERRVYHSNLKGDTK